MRKQIDGMAVLVEQVRECDVFELSLFLFCNTERRILKALHWDLSGFCLWQKAAGEGPIRLAAHRGAGAVRDRCLEASHTVRRHRLLVGEPGVGLRGYEPNS
jgi:hypothetical protein